MGNEIKLTLNVKLDLLGRIKKRCLEGKQELDRIYRHLDKLCEKCSRELDTRTRASGLKLCGRCRQTHKKKQERNGYGR